MIESEESFVAPLLNFSTNFPSFNLNDDIWLRKITRDEFQKMIEQLPLGEMYRHWLVWSVFYVLESKMRNFLDAVDRVLLAFRLVRIGDIKAPIAFQLSKTGMRFVGKELSSPYVLGRKYFLKKEEAAKVISLFGKLQDLSSKPHLDFAITQFMDAYEKRQPIDKIVDFVSAFDSLVFYREPRSYEPAGKIIGIATALLLGKNQKERIRIKDTIQRAYDLRSEKLHGNLEKLEKHGTQYIEKLAIEVEHYLRCSLRKFVEE